MLGLTFSLAEILFGILGSVPSTPFTLATSLISNLLLAGLAGLAVGLALNKRFSQSVNKLVHSLETVNAEEDIALTQIQPLNEHFDQDLDRWVAATNNVLNAAHQKQRECQEAQQQLASFSRFDRLTGLTSRDSFHYHLNEACESCTEDAPLTALLHCDLKNFQRINTEYGVAFGDWILKEVARRIQTSISPKDHICRLGGDRFAVLLTEITEIPLAKDICQRMIHHLQEPFSHNDQIAKIDIAIGAAFYPDHGNSNVEMIQSAERALSLAKTQPISHCHFYHAELTDSERQEDCIRRDLKSAIENEKLAIRYQPQFELGTGRLISAEALLRWEHPLRGQISPASFLPIAEACGLLEPISNWVIGRACHHAACWGHTRSDVPVNVSINLSLGQLLDPQLCEKLSQQLRMSGLIAERLTIEVSETTLPDSLEEISRAFSDLTNMGIEIVLDNFGLGSVSLNHLQHLPVTAVKIDRGLIARIDGHSNDEASSQENSDAHKDLIKAMISMSHSLGITVIAAGIETTNQLNFLRQVRCNRVQGFLFSRPLDPLVFGKALCQKDPLVPDFMKLLRDLPIDRRQQETA